jgi:hypothetical protein
LKNAIYPLTFFSLAPLFGSSLPYWNTGLITQYLGRVISSSHDLYLTQDDTNTEKRGHTLNIHAQDGIRTRNHGVRAIEDCSCLRPLGYSDRQSGTKFAHDVSTVWLVVENQIETRILRSLFVKTHTTGISCGRMAMKYIHDESCDMLLTFSSRQSSAGIAAREYALRHILVDVNETLISFDDWSSASMRKEGRSRTAWTAANEHAIIRGAVEKLTRHRTRTGLSHSESL